MHTKSKYCPKHGYYRPNDVVLHDSLCDSSKSIPQGGELCLNWGCKCPAMFCDTYCDFHRQIYGLYQPMTYAEAYKKAKAKWAFTGSKHFVYRHKGMNTSHKGYGTARVNAKNWCKAIFSEMVFPNKGLVSTETAQRMLFVMGGDKKVASLVANISL